MFSFSARHSQRNTLIRPLRNTGNSANNSSGNIETQSPLTRANVARNKASFSLKVDPSKQLQSAVAPHLKEAKSPQEMAQIKRQHAALIQQLQNYRNLVGKSHDVQLSDAELEEKDRLKDTIYTQIEEIVINSRPRQKQRQVDNIEKELTVLAQDFGYSGTDEEARKTAIVNSFAYMGQKYNYSNGKDQLSSPGCKLSLGMAVLMYKGNSQISDVYRAISNNNGQLDGTVSHKAAEGIQTYARGKPLAGTLIGSAVTAVAVAVGMGVADIEALGDNVVSASIIGLGAGNVALSASIPAFSIVRKKRIDSDKPLRTKLESHSVYHESMIRSADQEARLDRGIEAARNARIFVQQAEQQAEEAYIQSMANNSAGAGASSDIPPGAMYFSKKNN